MNITINGMRHTAQKGQTILGAARAVGVYIPTLCYHEKVGAHARCRTCVVEVKGSPGLVTACNTVIADGMEIVTGSERALEVQRFVIKLALSSGNHDCIICEKTGACELQDAAYNLKIESTDIWKAERLPHFDDSSAFIRIDHTKCILCGRCAEACNHVVVNRAMKVMKRGYEAEIGFGCNDPMGESSCVQCGECTRDMPGRGPHQQEVHRQGPSVGSNKSQDHVPLLRCGLPAGPSRQGREDHEIHRRGGRLPQQGTALR